MNVQIVDTTLRDGEQSAGLIFSSTEKAAIAKALDRAGVFAIEAGIPAMGKEEQAALESILGLNLKAQVVAWNRANLEDIQASIKCGFSFIHISIPISDLHINYKLKKTREWIFQQLADSIAYARSFGSRVFVGAEDASRADENLFLRVAETAAELGAERIRYADTIGCLDPFKTSAIMQRLVPRSALPIEIHLHNDFGLATANAVAAIQAGVKLVSVTVGGIGERAGNVPLEQLMTVLSHLYNIDTGINKAGLPELANIVNDACRQNVTKAL